MVGALRRLVDEHPHSPFRPQAAIVLGDHLRDQQDLEGAARAYAMVAGGDAGKAVALAHYRLAWIHVNRESCPAALREFERAVAAYDAAGEAVDEETLEIGEAIDVRRSAIVDMVYCYSQERPHRRALRDFRALAGDRATYVAALRRLARRYALMDNAHATLPVVRELLALAPASEERLDDARALHTALRGAADWDRIDRDVRLLLGTVERTVQRLDVEGEERDTLRAEFEVYARDLLTRAQDGMRETRNAARKVRRAEALAAAYAHYLDRFGVAPEGELGEHELDMRMNLADVLAAAERPYAAGQRLVEAAERMEDPEARRQALYDAVGRFSEALETRDHDRDEYGDRSIAPSALRNAAAQLMRHELEPDQLRRVRFALAQSYYDQGRYAEAIDRLTALAYEFPQSEEAQAAARLVLDSYNTLDDAFGLMHAGRRFLAEGTPVPGLRSELEPLVAAAEQRMVDEVSLEQAGDDGGDLEPLLELAREHEGTDLGERALMNAFLAARAAGDTAQMYTLGEELAQAYPSSEQLAGVLSTLGQMAVGRFEVDEALTFLERAAEAGHERQGALRVAAGQLLEALGREDEAQAAYEAAMGGEGAPEEAMVQLAALLERRGDADALVNQLAELPSAPPEVRARVGLAMVATGRGVEAEEVFQQVLATASTPEALARAHYGMAALLQAALSQFGALEGPELVEEYLAVVDLAQSSYIEAVRQGDPAVGALALGRLGALADEAAAALGSANLDGLDAEMRRVIERGLGQRAEAYAQTATEARAQCANRAWESHVFTPGVRRCLRGESATAVLPEADRLERGGGRTVDGADETRARVAQNPEDLQALRALAARHLEAGDAHTARLVLQAIAERGPRPEDLEQLGVASARIGDHAGALRAFARAADAGSASAREKLEATLRELGLRDAAAEVGRRFGQERLARGPGPEDAGGRR